MSTTLAVSCMESGECRWIGRHDVHVYCRRPSGVDPAYCVVCPDAGLQYGHWVCASDAAEVIDSLLTARGAA